MKKKKSIIILIALFAIILIIIGYFSYQLHIKNVLKENVYDYFKNNNAHISSQDFKITDFEIACKGKKAYIVDFSITFEDSSNKLSDLGALVYQEDKKWNVQSILNKETEIESYNLKCYKRK